MFCGKCGCEMADGAEFCGKCGAKAEDIKQITENIADSIQNSGANYGKDCANYKNKNNADKEYVRIAKNQGNINAGSKAKKKNKLMLIIPAAIIVAVAIAMIGIFFINSDARAYEKQIEIGYELLEKGKYEEAVLAFDEAVKIDDKRADAYMGKAEAMANDPDMDVDKAEKILEVLNEGYKKSGDRKVIRHKKQVEKIIRDNGFESVAEAIFVYDTPGKRQIPGRYPVNKSKYGNTYPLKSGDTELTYWAPMNAAIYESATNFGDLPIAKALEKKTGVKINYVHPSLTNAQEKFTLMIASGELTDMIQYGWNAYPGGPQKAIDEGIILPLNEKGNSMIEAWAPDFKKALEKNPDAAKEAKTDSGMYYAAGMISSDRKLNTTAGPIIRQDWLDELGLDMPKTIDDWHKTLTAFKEQKGATAPLAMSNQGFFCGFVSGAYGVNPDFYHDNGVVKFGGAEQGYKEFLTTMNQWYNEGLYDKNFSTTDSSAITSNLINGKSGATWNALGGGIGVLTNAIKESDPNAVFAGAPYPTLDGSKSEFGQASARFVAYTVITTQCKDPELAMKWLNYGYTEEGHMLYNFGLTKEDAKQIGIDSYSYEWVERDGKKYPQYTELVKNNPDGLSMTQAFAVYSKAGQGGNYSQDLRYLEQYAGLPQQQKAWEVWADTNTFEHYVPNTGVPADVAKEYARIYTDVCAFRDENFIKFVAGGRPLSEFNQYVQELKNLGLDKLIEMKQQAYDNYLER